MLKPVVPMAKIQTRCFEISGVVNVDSTNQQYGDVIDLEKEFPNQNRFKIELKTWIPVAEASTFGAVAASLYSFISDDLVVNAGVADLTGFVRAKNDVDGIQEKLFEAATLTARYANGADDFKPMIEFSGLMQWDLVTSTKLGLWTRVDTSGGTPPATATVHSLLFITPIS